MRGLMTCWSVWLLLAGSVPAREREPADSIRYHLDPMVIIGHKIAGPQSELPASVSVIEEARLSRSASYSVLETIQAYVPSLYLTERAVMGYGLAAGAAGGISMRGLGGSPVTGVLMLRDGRPDMMGLMGHPLPDTYSIEGIERVEVIRGPASFLYGTNALGGVINLVSKTVARPGFQTRLTSGFGSFQSRQLSLAHGGNTGFFDYYLTAATRSTQGHRSFSAYEGDQYTAHAGYRLAAKTRLELNANLANIYLLDPGPANAASWNGDHWYDIRRAGVDLTLDHAGAMGETNIKLHTNFGRHKLYDGFRSTDRTAGLMMFHHWRPWSGQTLTIGFDWKQYGGMAENILQPIDYGGHFISEWAPYLHSQQWLTKKLLASAGFRLEHHPLTGSKMLPKVGLVYTLFPQAHLRLSMAEGFRSPSIRELYLFPAPNLALRPEVMRNYEVGFSQCVAGRLKWEGTLFRSIGHDLIRTSGRWPTIQLVNSGAFTHTGFEWTMEWFVAPSLQIGASWSKNDLQDQTMYAPGKKITLYGISTLGPVQLNIHLLTVQDLYGADFHQWPMDDYTVINAELAWQVTKSVRLALAAKNLLQARYQTLYGYPMPGRYFFAQTTISL